MKDSNNNKRSNIFIKLNISKFLDEHLLSELGPERTQTLIGLALFLPDIFPSQSYLSSVLGISQPSVSKRIRDLSNFIFFEEPIIQIKKSRNYGRFESNEYILGKNCGISIFDYSQTTNQTDLNTIYRPPNKVLTNKG
jgi:hypothetical protein